MSGDRFAVAFERLDVAADGDRPPAAAPGCDLAELAAALAEVEALVTTGTEQNPDALAAIERVADIAFVLHEREVEPSLCDALDSAMREISAANARNHARVQRAHKAAELLRALARRLDAMMAAQAQPQVLPPVAHEDEFECADEFRAPARLFDGDVAEDSAFAQTVAALAQSLPKHAEAAPRQFPDQAADSAAMPEELAHSDVKPEPVETSLSAWMQTANPVTGAGGQRAPHHSAPVSAAVSPPDAAAGGSFVSSAVAVAAPTLDTHCSIDPDEDPGDLFESSPDLRPAPDAPAPSPAISLPARQTAPAASLSLHLSHSPGSAPACVASRPAASDPLAPIRALSEEELIALFS